MRSAQLTECAFDLVRGRFVARPGERIHSFGPACGIRMPSANWPMAHGSHGALWSECARPTWTRTCVRRESILSRRRIAARAAGAQPACDTKCRQGGFEGLAQAGPTRSARLALRARLDACKRKARRSETLEPDHAQTYSAISVFVKHRLGTISTPDATSIPYREVAPLRMKRDIARLCTIYA